MTPVDPRDPASIRSLSRGRCYLYVAPCINEDLLKLGFSRDPLERLQSLHRRWFELFDPDRTLLVELDTVREARALELELQRELALHNAPAPLTVERAAGGQGEWYRGAGAGLEESMRRLAARGHAVHAPAREWLRNALRARGELLFSWSQAILTPDELELRAGITPAQAVVRDALDAYEALDLAPDAWLPAEVLRWYRAGGGLR